MAVTYTCDRCKQTVGDARRAVTGRSKTTEYARTDGGARYAVYVGASTEHDLCRQCVLEIIGGDNYPRARATEVTV